MALRSSSRYLDSTARRVALDACGGRALGAAFVEEGSVLGGSSLTGGACLLACFGGVARGCGFFLTGRGGGGFGVAGAAGASGAAGGGAGGSGSDGSSDLMGLRETDIVSLCSLVGAVFL